MTAKRAGVLGGMGPEATLVFLARFYALTRGRREQDRPALLIDLNPAVPDRNEAWQSASDAPAAALAEMGCRLARAGADFCVMPCITAHGYAADFETAAGIPLMRLPEITAEAFAANGRPGPVGLLATTTSIEMRLFHEAFARAGIEALCPPAPDQECLMQAIYALKRGEDVRDDVISIADRLVAGGAQTLLVGCTDLSLLELTEVAGQPVVDALDLLARRTLEETA